MIAGTVFQGTKLPLTVWFLAIHLISQAKTGLSALALKRQIGVSYRTAWLIQHKTAIKLSLPLLLSVCHITNLPIKEITPC